MNKREQWKAAKAAYKAAKKDGKTPAEIDALRVKMEQLEEEAEAEEAAEQKKADAAKNASAAEVTLKELSEMVQKSIKDALPDQSKALKVEDIEAVVAKAMEKHAKASAESDAKLTKENVGAVVGEAMKALTDSMRSKSRMEHAEDDAGRIEIPVGRSKGNLSVAHKQLLNRLMNRDMNLGIDQSQLDKANAAGAKMFERAQVQGIKAMTSTGAGAGDEWVPTDLSSELQRRLFLESALAQAMLARQIEMPTNPYTLPMVTTRPSMYLQPTESTATTASDPTSALATLTAAKIMGRVLYSYEVEEDSIVPILGTLTQLLGEAAAYSLEDAIINGDTTATHQDSDTHAVANHPAKAWKGFRKLALAVTQLKVDLSTGNITRANLLSVLKKLKKYGKSLKDLVWICGAQTHTDILGLDEVTTLDKAGPRATVFTGNIAAYFGIPIIVSEANREDLNASGVFDNTTTTKGSVLCANLAQFILGNRREFVVETDKDIDTQQNKIVISFRKAFVPLETPSATVTSVACGYNYAA